ncbi:MAG: hypothetical protein GY850_33815 [bacterium]|nr:hypothetical protein [bacterium]
MNIVCGNGSPHESTGTTGLVMQHFLQGAEKAGAQTESFLLTNNSIKP